MDKKLVEKYYLNIYPKMQEFMQGKQIMGIQLVPHPVVKKHEKGNPIHIKSFDPSNKEDPSNFFYYPDKHYVDFHIIHGEKTDIIPIDIDPNRVPASKALVVAKMAKMMLRPISKDIDIFHSGGRGYHVIAKLDKPMSTRQARKMADTAMKPLLQMFSFTTDKPPQKGEIRIDTSTFHPGGSIRVPYSINYKTGVPSKKID